ncbi:hypothetical protein IJJ39_02070 [Candidatus Saccharibacteria bacterium]|nr:hypothetical protein [Candidatus Saccharibacteria bacterium]
MAERQNNQDGETESTKKAKEEAKAAAKKKYLERKEWAMNQEKENYSKIFLVKMIDDKWWKAFDHSAILYKYVVCASLKNKARVLPDKDYSFRSKIGCVSFQAQSLESLTEKMDVVGYKLVKSTPVIKIYDLGMKVSPEDFEEMVHRDEILLERTNKLILPEERVTDLLARAREVNKAIHEATRKVDAVSRVSYCARMDELSGRLIIDATRASRGTLDFGIFLKRVADILEELHGYTVIMTNLLLVEPKKIFDIAMKISNMEKLLRKEMQKYGERMAKKNMNDAAKELGGGDVL